MASSSACPRPGDDGILPSASSHDHPTCSICEKASGIVCTCKRTKPSNPSPPLQRACLPDEMLLRVFRLLPLEALVRVCGVCRRWRRVGLDPALWGSWRRGRMFLHHPERGLRLLSLAPRLGQLCMERPYRGPMPPALLQAWSQTECSVEDLMLKFPKTDAGTLVRLQTVLRRQVDLGRLRKLTLNVPFESAASMVLQVWHAGLSHLSLALASLHENILFRPCLGNEVGPAQTPVPALDPAIPPPKGGASLLYLRYRSATADVLLEQLLAAHAASLQEVQVDSPVELSACALELLGSCTSLRRVLLPICSDLSSLAGCSELRELSLSDFRHCRRSRDTAHLAGIFATTATKLEVLRLCTIGWTAFGMRDPLQVVAALSSSGHAALRELWLFNPLAVANVAFLVVLPGLLRGLSHLHTLHLAVLPPDEVLDEITAETAPSLRLLLLEPDACAERGCRFQRLKRLLDRCPGLHGGPVRIHGEQCFCQCCSQGLHPRDPSTDVLGGVLPWRHCWVFGHDPAEQCDLEAHRRSECRSASFSEARGYTLCPCDPVWQPHV